MKVVRNAIVGAVLIGGALLVLALTCPSEDSFDRWAKDAFESDSGSVVDQAKGKALSTQARWTADYEDHVLWATVEAYQGGSRQRYLGILGTWFRLGEEPSDG